MWLLACKLVFKIDEKSLTLIMSISADVQSTGPRKILVAVDFGVSHPLPEELIDHALTP